MAIGPQHISDEDLRERLLGRMPSMPRRGMPGTATPEPIDVPAITAPTALPPAVPPPTPQGPQMPTESPKPRPSRMPVPPEVAEYAARMAGGDPDGIPAARQPSRSPWALVAGIASGLRGQPYDYKTFADMDARAQASRDRAVAEANADAGSQRSAQARARSSAVLKQLGLTDQDIANLTAEDLAAMNKGGNLVAAVAEARQKAQAAKDKLAAEQAELERKKAEKSADREYDQSENDRRSARDFEEQQVIARIQAEVAAGKMVDAAKLADFYAQAREARSRQAAIEEEQRKKQTKIDEAKAFRIPGIEVTDNDRFTRTAMDDVQRRKLEDSASGYKMIADATKRMRELREEYGVELPGKAATDYSTARNSAISGMSVLMATGVINPGEFERYKADLPDITPTKEDLWSLVVGGDVKAKNLAGFEDSILGTIDSRLAPFGAKLSRGGDSAVAAAKASPAPAARPKPKPKANPQPAQPPATPTEATPGWNDLGGGPSTGVRIRDPKTGRTGTYPGTAAEAKAEGYEVIGG